MRDLARWLLEDGLITESELRQAEQTQEDNGVPLSMALIQLDMVGERELVELVSRRHGIPKAPRKLYKSTVPAKALTIIPQDHCWQHGLFPFGLDLPSKTVQVAILDPGDQEALALLQRLPSGLEAELYVAGPKQLEKAIRKHYMDSIVEDTNAPGLRFFGYDNITNPGVSGGNDTGSFENIILAEPDKSPPPTAAPPPEPALSAQERGRGEIPLPPPGKPRSGELHAVPSRPPTGEAPAVRAVPATAAAPAQPAERRSQLPIARVSTDSGRTAELEQRVEALERALLDLLELVARNSMDLSGRLERIAGELNRTSRD